jgi:ADP-ribose pyrophosphatase
VTNSEKIHFMGRFLGMMERDRWEYAFRTNASGVVVLVPVTDDGELVLVEQHRTPVNARVLELPAGLVGDSGNRDEDFKEAANRELVEETGYRATALEELLVGPSTPGMSDEIITIYFAGGLEKTGPGGGDGSEDITVHLMPLDDAESWLREKSDEGILLDPKIYAGMYWAGMRNSA